MRSIRSLATVEANAADFYDLHGGGRNDAFFNDSTTPNAEKRQTFLTEFHYLAEP
jgi:hypothetical protein